MKKLLHLQDLDKSFGRQMVLNHVSFELQPGEIIGLIGPSGAGKSTMIKTMLGMEKADGGEALVLDHTMPNRHILGDIGYMAQSDALYEACGTRLLVTSVSKLNRPKISPLSTLILVNSIYPLFTMSVFRIIFFFLILLGIRVVSEH